MPCDDAVRVGFHKINQLWVGLHISSQKDTKRFLNLEGPKKHKHGLHFSKISVYSKVFYGKINCVSTKNDLLSK